MGISRGAWWVWAAASLVCVRSGLPAQSLSRSNAVMRAGSLPPPGALGSFHIKPGFRIELLASEPMVCAPVALAFDEHGRLFVAEQRDYPDQRDASPHLGRIRLLEAPDDHGVYQASRIYADDLRLPSAVACYGGGVFVAATPEIRFLKTGENGDDIDRVVLSGFGGTNQVSPDRLLNNFNWGLQHRLYVATAALGGTVAPSNWPGTALSLAGANISFEPRGLQIFPEAGPTSSGFCFDNLGRAFGSDFDHPLRVAMYDPRYTARNPFYPRPDSMRDAANPATPIYHRRANGSNMANLPPGRAPLNDNANAPAWFTHASGCVVYRGSAFPSNYFGNVFVAAPDAHVVHRFALHEHGLEISAERAPDEAATEFLISDDPSFRPVQIINGPEGALYIADRQDNPERGRIYRILPSVPRSEGGRRSPDTSPPRRPVPPKSDEGGSEATVGSSTINPQPSDADEPQDSKLQPAVISHASAADLGKSTTYELAAALAQTDGWRGDTAARLLYERRDPDAARLFTNMVVRAPTPLGRVRALHALDAVAALDLDSVLRALQDKDAHVRGHAILLSERFASSPPLELWTQLKALSADPSISVRCQLAFSLGEFPRPDRSLVLAQVLLRDSDNRWIQNAVLSSVPEGAGALFALLAAQPRFANDPQGQQFLRTLAAMIGTKGRLDEVQQAITAIAGSNLPRPVAFDLGFALGDGLRRTRSSLALVDTHGLLAGLYSYALFAVVDASYSESARVSAVQFLSVSPYTFDDVSDWLLLLCNPQPLTALRSAAIEALGRYDVLRVQPALLERWSTLPPLLRNQAITALLSRTNRVAGVLAAARAGRIDASSFSSAQLNLLRSYPEPAIRDFAVRLFGPLRLRRPDSVERFKPALQLNGVPERGRRIFEARCASCHAPASPRAGSALPNGAPANLGPALDGAKVKGKEKILEAILEPSAEIQPQFATWLLQTNQGENLLGIITDQNPLTITLRQLGGTEQVWPRLNLQAYFPQSWSLMPDGLELGLAPQDMADLLAFVLSAH